MTMKARIERDMFAKALKIVSPHTPKMTAKAVLNGVRMDGDGQHLTLTCTDLDVTARVTIDATAEGTAIAPAGLLTRLVGAMGAGAVSIKADDMVHVECGDTLAELHSYQVDDWPKLEVQDGEPVELDAQVWARLGRVVQMASTDASRAKLGTVQFKDGHANVTDSYRAAIVELGFDVAEALVPASAITAVMRVAEPPVTLTIGKRTASFTSNGVTLTTRLIEDDYPDLSKFLRATSPTELSFPSADIVEVIERLALIGTTDNAVIVIKRDGDKAVLSTSEQDVGSMTDIVPCTGTYDEQIAFNPKFLAQMIKAAAVDEVTLQLDGRKQAEVITEGVSQLLMPVKLP